MVELLRSRGISITKEEATVMMLGIYEDTGSLTFSSTTVEDYQAAAYLLECGADLNTLSDLITSEFTMDQISLLNDLIQAKKSYSFHGIDIYITEASADGYVGDLAVLVHKIKDMENLNVLFALARMENRVFLVARSRIDEVDVGEIARCFGGGGHPTAASATIKGLTLYQVREQLLRLLEEKMRPRKKAREIMSFPVKSVAASATIREAQEALTRYNINAMPIMEDEHLVGIITRQVLEKAAYHGLDSSPVSKFMSTEYEVVSPDDPLEAVHGLVVGRNQRLVPVMDDNTLVGVITRTDFMHAILPHSQGEHGEVSEEEFRPKGLRDKRLTRLMKERLPQHVFELLQRLGTIAELVHMNAYVVGGFVRDLMMRHDNLDIDLVLEGDGIRFAEEVSQQLSCRIRSHARFGTAQLAFPDNFRIDIATARLEYYERPAALPSVERSSLKLDLYRRDFTINSLAIRINPRGFGEIVDFFGGQKDIKDKTIRVIHNLSFIEDPTRIFRALRFGERFGFQLGKQTQLLMQNAIKMGILERLDGRRLFGELRLILEEDHVLKILERLDEMDLLHYIHPTLTLDARLRSVLRHVQEICSWFHFLYLDVPYEPWMVYFLSLTAYLNDEALDALMKQIAIKSRDVLRKVEAKKEAEQILKGIAGRNVQLTPSKIYHMLHLLPIEVLLYMMIKTTRESTRKSISLYITRLRDIKPTLTGDDLKAIGLKPGPQFKKILDSLLDARLDGKVTDRPGEMAWVRDHYAKKHMA
jgi:tRNA nucleotidyltransferase (CCA-adding enzyme)